MNQAQRMSQSMQNSSRMNSSIDSEINYFRNARTQKNENKESSKYPSGPKEIPKDSRVGKSLRENFEKAVGIRKVPLVRVNNLTGGQTTQKTLALKKRL